MRARVVPVLLIDDGGLVKSVEFGKYNYIGDPMNAIRLYNEMEVDELVILDISASKKNRAPDFEMIEELASNAFMPLGYGGGISSIDDIKKLFYSGVEKVIINNQLLSNKSFIKEAAKLHGKQSIVGSVDIKKNFFGSYKVYDHVKNKTLDIDYVDFVKDLEGLGIGELFVNDVLNDGKMKGYDIKLIDRLHDSVSIPVVFCGGAGKLADIKKAIDSGAHAAAAGSIFIYKSKAQGVLINYPTQEELYKLLGRSVAV
jgi:imidazole glycerol-phosphate synthase subunit HisF